MSNEIRLKVGESKQRDAGRGKARIGDDAMSILGIKVGDAIEIKGKKITAAMVWPAYQEDQGKKLIRIDGLLRKNAEVPLNEYVTVKKCEVKDAQSVILAPVDMRLNVDSDFTDFVKSRLLEKPIVEKNSVFVVILGSAIPFIIVNTRPHGIVKVKNSTNLQVLSEPSTEKRRIPKVTHKHINGLHEEIRKERIRIQEQIQNVANRVTAEHYELTSKIAKLELTNTQLNKRLSEIEQKLKTIINTSNKHVKTEEP